MSETQIYETLNGIFRDIFDDESLVVTANTRAADVPGWDSANHLQVILATEMKFGIKFTTTEVESLRSVGDLVRMVQQKRKKT